MLFMQGSGKMTVQVKTPKEKQAVEVEEGATIKQVSMTNCYSGLDRCLHLTLDCARKLLFT